MDAQTALKTTEVFIHGFSAGVAFGVLLLGLVIAFTRSRRDP